MKVLGKRLSRGTLVALILVALMASSVSAFVVQNWLLFFTDNISVKQTKAEWSGFIVDNLDMMGAEQRVDTYGPKTVSVTTFALLKMHFIISSESDLACLKDLNVYVALSGEAWQGPMKKIADEVTIEVEGSLTYNFEIKVDKTAVDYAEGADLTGVIKVYLQVETP